MALQKPSAAAVASWLARQSDAVLALAFSPCGMYLAAGTRLGRLLCWQCVGVGFPGVGQQGSS